jgi:hypothetical protein
MITEYDINLYRIRCTKEIPSVAKVGDLGGWIEKPGNLSGNAWVAGNAQVYGNARVSGDARVYGDAQVYGNARVYGNAKVCDQAKVYGEALVSSYAQVCADAEVYDKANVCDQARIYGDARILNDRDYCYFQSFGSKGCTTTAFRQKDGSVRISSGFFDGTLEEIEKRVEQTHGDNQLGREYKAIIQVIKIKFELI